MIYAHYGVKFSINIFSEVDMRSRLMLLLAVSLSLLLFSCGGGGGTVSSDNMLKVTTTIDLDDGSTMAGAKSASKAASDMTVTLTLPDGTTVTMQSTGNGNEYECYINYTEGDPVYIKAVYGDVVLKNFIDSIDTSSSVVALESVTPTTTLFVDVLESMVETLESVGSTDMVAHLLQGVKNATLEIDVTTVREEVTESDNPVYSVLRETYATNLTWVTLESGAVASDTLYSQVATIIESGGVNIPAETDEAAAIEAAALSVMSKLFSGDISGLTALMYTANFLNGGYDMADFILEAADEFSGFSSSDVTIINNTAKATKVTSSDPAYALISSGPMYRIQNALHYQYKVGGVVVREEQYDDAKSGYPGFVMQKIGTAWYGIGDRYKAEYDMILTSDESMSHRKIHAEVCEGSTDIDTVTVTSPAFSGYVSLTRNPYDMECLSAEIYENGSVYGWDSVTGWTSLPSTTPVSTLCGKSVTAVVTFDDASTETRTVILPPCATKTLTSSVSKDGSGNVVVSFTVPAEADKSEIRIQGNVVFPGGYEEMVMEKEYLPFSGTSTSFDASLFTSGMTYRFRLHYTDIYNRLYIDTPVDIVY